MVKLHSVSRELGSTSLGEVRVIDGSNPVDNVVRFEIFQGLPVSVAFSWGKAHELDAPLNFSTSQKFSDPDIDSKRTEDFLRRTDLPGISDLILIRPTYPPNPEGQIIYVSQALKPLLDSSNGVSEADANFLWTKEKGIVLGVKPADCVAIAAYGKNDRGEDVLGVGHLSYHLVDLNLGFDAMKTLIGEGVRPEDIKIAIGPSVFMDDYSFPMHDRGLIKNDANWHGGLEVRGERLYLDLARATIGQLIAAGIPPQNIEIMIDNTFDAASNRESFSDRYAKSMKDVDPGYQDGRMIFVAGLKE